MNEKISPIVALSAANSKTKYKRLIAGPRGMFIYNECVDLCREFIEEKGTIAFFSTESPLFLLCASYEAR